MIAIDHEAVPLTCQSLGTSYVPRLLLPTKTIHYLLLSQKVCVCVVIQLSRAENIG